MAAGAIESSSAQMENYLYTHAMKVFEVSRETFFKKFLWSPKAKRAWGRLFSKSVPTKNAEGKKGRGGVFSKSSPTKKLKIDYFKKTSMTGATMS